MKPPNYLLAILSLVSLFFIKCSKTRSTETTRLQITLKDEAGNIVSGANVRLYKDDNDPGIIRISDVKGIALFSDLETIIYYWYAEKGCRTNRQSSTTLGTPCVPHALVYGNSTLSETGTLKIINNSPDAYNLSLSNAFYGRLSDNHFVIYYPKIGSLVVHSEKVSTPGIGKDTLIQVACGITNSISLPY